MRKSMGEIQRLILNEYSIVGDPKGFESVKLGKGVHTKIFRAEDFKKELAPKNAEIKRFEVNEEKFIRMKY